MKQKNKVLQVMLTVLVLILVAGGIGYLINKKDTDRMLELTQQQLETYRDKDGKQVARITYLENQRVTDILDLETKDSEIRELQELVKKYKGELRKGGSATIIKGETRVDTVIREVAVSGDSIYPTYSSPVALGRWVVGNVSANRDSIALDLSIANEYHVVMGRERSGFLGLGKRRPFAEVTNQNPYSETTSIRTYSVDRARPLRWGIGPYVGYGWSDGGIRPGFTTGISLNYNLIRF